MKYFNIPADYKKETIDKYSELNEKYPHSKVIETYGQVTIGNKVGSGRAYGLIPQLGMAELKDYITYSESKQIGFNYTLNTTCLGNREFTREGMEEITAFLEQLYDVGVRSLTVAMPSLIELIRLKGLDFEIKASTLCNLTNVNKVMALKQIGVDKIVIDESVNRDFESLRKIRTAFGEKVELITNVICHKNCVYRPFHYNQTSHDKGEENPSGSYYSHRCIMKRSESAANILKLSWIRPEDIKHYTDIGIHYFKIQGRQAVAKGDPVRTVECYINESYDGNLLDLLDMFDPTNSFKPFIDNQSLNQFINPFLKTPNFCKNDCTTCSYCETYARKNFNYSEVQSIYDTANKFYKEYDGFIRMAREDKEKNKEDGLFALLNGNMDF